MASPVSLKLLTVEPHRYCSFTAFFSTPPNQKYVGRKEWAIQAISVLSSALPELAQSRLRASSNPVIKPLIISLPGSHFILKTLQPEQDFHAVCKRFCCDIAGKSSTSYLGWKAFNHKAR